MCTTLLKLGTSEEELCSYSSFLTELRESFPLVREARTHKLGRCDLCVSLKLKESGAQTDQDRLRFRQERQEHLTNMFQEREGLNNVHLAALMKPDETLALTIDHANGIRLPHQHQYPKSLSTIVRPRAEVFGAIDHGKGTRILIPHLQIFPHNANLTISLVFFVLCRRASEGVLPLDLHLAGDNCAKENKNRILIAFLLLLVGLRIFRRIILEMLPQGHTHTEIDALFSWISTALNAMNVGSLTEMIANFLPFAFKHQQKKPIIAHMPPVYDWSSWLDPALRHFEGLSQFRSFKFEARFLVLLLHSDSDVCC